MGFPYDTAQYILNAARARIDDLITTPANAPTSGSPPDLQFTAVGGANLLALLNPDNTICLRTQVYFNNGYRKFQSYLANLGYRRLIGDGLIISALPPNVNPDPAAQSWISWNGFFNGTTFTTTPKLPLSVVDSDGTLVTFYAPLYVWERVTGQNSTFTPMRCALDGIQCGNVKGIFNGQWEWRQDRLYLRGANGQTDIQLRFIQFMPDLVQTGSPTTPWYDQLVPFVRCDNALSWFIAYEVCFPRGDEPGSAGCLSNAQAAADEIFNNQGRADQRTNLRRRPRGGGSRSRSSGYGYGL